MCSRNQFLLHLFYTTLLVIINCGNSDILKGIHVSLVKDVLIKFFQCLQSSPPASTRSLQLPFVLVCYLLLKWFYENPKRSNPGLEFLCEIIIVVASISFTYFGSGFMYPLTHSKDFVGAQFICTSESHLYSCTCLFPSCCAPEA